MSEGEKQERSEPSRGSARKWIRSFWFAVVLVVGGSGVAGFSVALLFGVHASFSQPLATLLAGGGALTAGVLAYLNGERGRDQIATHHRADMDRERERHLEDSRRARESDLRDRYTAIATQIAHDSAAIRQAGVYALTALGDDWHALGEDDERQVCINLLQWYLRVPLPQTESPDLSELEIRQTIVGILVQSRHRPPHDPRSWSSITMSLSQASLCHCTLAELDFSGLGLDRADLTEARLFRANLSDADLSGAKLIRANLLAARLNGANLTSADLSFAKMHRAKLNEATLTHAKLNEAKLNEAGLNAADLTHADLSGAKLNEAALTDADLTGANLSGADLTGANLSGANLTAADLSGANLTDARR